MFIVLNDCKRFYFYVAVGNVYTILILHAEFWIVILDFSLKNFLHLYSKFCTNNNYNTIDLNCYLVYLSKEIIYGCTIDVETVIKTKVLEFKEVNTIKWNSFTNYFTCC